MNLTSVVLIEVYPANDNERNGDEMIVIHCQCLEEFVVYWQWLNRSQMGGCADERVRIWNSMKTAARRIENFLNCLM